MKIENAIEILHQTAQGGFSQCTWGEQKKAAALGVEALKRLLDNRRDPEFDHWVPLLGETPPPDPGDE